MIPLRDENPARSTPYITYILVAVNVVIFLYNGTLTQDARNPLAGFELIPAQLLTGRDLGAPTPIAPWLTIFSSMFMHANFLHIAGNMLYLWIFGNNVEDALGHFRFLIFYALAGVGAAAAQIVLNPLSTIPMVGASGAIAGVLAAYFILFPGARVVSLVFYSVTEMPASLLIGWWIVIQVVSTLLAGSQTGGGVAYAAHVGGFVAGFTMVAILGGRRLLRGRERYVDYRRRRW